MKPPARWARACLTGGVVLLTVVVISWFLLPSGVDDFGSDQSAAAPPVAGQQVDIKATGGISPVAGTAAAQAESDPSEIDTAPAATTPAAKAAVPAAGIPISLSLPSLGVQADVHPIGINDGVLEVPTDPADVGWWTGSVAAGSSSGATIIDGHVDSAEYGIGALYRLTELGVGDTVEVTVAGGGKVTYRVNERRSYDKESGLPAGIFSIDGAPRLVLITCGGAFDRETGSYESNVAVFANPI